jgi:hypothetical protein
VLTSDARVSGSKAPVPVQLTLTDHSSSALQGDSLFQLYEENAEAHNSPQILVPAKRGSGSTIPDSCSFRRPACVKGCWRMTA